ncbi:MAG: acetyl/propionyl/methylcrotonyl-CoA carboxylase subunit alpha [Hyphomicrobiales bacterium]
MKRVLIANRGEIALRAVRACRKAGLETVAIYSQPDENSPHCWVADRRVCIGPAPANASYLRAGTLIEAAKATGCDAIYPGYGFLSEKADFARACAEEKLIFIGPSPEAIATMGDKVAARNTAERNGLPIVPGSPSGFTDVRLANEASSSIGFPILLKAAGGGGGRGMRVVDDPAQFDSQFAQASAEAGAAFGQSDVYLERFFRRVRHIEIQVFGDRHGNACHLWERDCSIQRRHQKLVEEAPSPVLDSKVRKQMAEASADLVRAIGYEGAGTIEFIYDLDSGEWFFIEMNTRIQVEHPVTEEVYGVDLVLEQLRVAAGEKLSISSPPPPNGRSAIEFRINAESPTANFRPSPGTIRSWQPPTGRGIRLDSHIYPGYAMPPFYDSLIGKLIVTGGNRKEMLERASSALSRFRVEGIDTTIPFHTELLGHPAFIDGSAHTRWVEQEMLS